MACDSTLLKYNAPEIFPVEGNEPGGKKLFGNQYRIGREHGLLAPCAGEPHDNALSHILYVVDTLAEMLITDGRKGCRERFRCHLHRMGGTEILFNYEVPDTVNEVRIHGHEDLDFQQCCVVFAFSLLLEQ